MLRIDLVANPISESPGENLAGLTCFSAAVQFQVVTHESSRRFFLRANDGVIYQTRDEAMKASVRFRDYLVNNPSAFASRAIELCAAEEVR